MAINVLEYVDDEEAILRAFERCLNQGGRLLALVPQGPGAYGTLDKAMGHRRRYRAQELRRLVESAGFSVEQMLNFNKIGSPPWYFFSRVLRRGRINKLTLKLFDKSVWLWRRLDKIFPWKGLSLIVVARKNA
jgi:hypothetical protein